MTEIALPSVPRRGAVGAELPVHWVHHLAWLTHLGPVPASFRDRKPQTFEAKPFPARGFVVKCRVEPEYEG